jgi:fermentation-respiration switch protein FrsA (DUF1100 family)
LYGFTEATITTPDDLQLLAWEAKPKTSDMPTILFFHGNAGTLDRLIPKAKALHGYGYGVLMPAYRGFSGNPGSPNEYGLYTDARGAMDYLNEAGVPNSKIILYGESLGTGIATQMAMEAALVEQPVRALVLEAPYTSIPDVGAIDYPWLPVHWLTLDRYDTLEKITRIETPLLIVHAEVDPVIPFAQARQLYEKAHEPKTFYVVPNVTTGGHSNLYDFGVDGPIDEFLRKL